MSNRSSLLFLAAALLASSFARDGRGADKADQDQARLDAAMLATNDAALVNFLQLRERGEPTQGTLDQLLANLAASAPDARAASLRGPGLHRDAGAASAAGPGARGRPIRRPGPALRDGHRRRWRHVDHGGRAPACQPPCFPCDDGAPRLSSPCRERSHPARHRGVVTHHRPQRKRDRRPGRGERPRRRAPLAAGHGRRPLGRRRPRAASRCPSKAASRSCAFSAIARGLGSRQGRRSPGCRHLDCLIGRRGRRGHAHRPSRAF